MKALLINEETYPVYLDWVDEPSKLELHTIDQLVLVIDPEVFQGRVILDKEQFNAQYEWDGDILIDDFTPVTKISTPEPDVEPVFEIDPEEISDGN